MQKTIKLSQWAKKQDISYRTANRWFKDGKLPDSVDSYQNPETGSIFITYDDGIVEPPAKKKLTIYENKLNSLESQFNKIQNQHPGISNMEQYMVSQGDMPEFGELKLYDYDNDMKEVTKESEQIIKSLVDLYLGDNKSIRNHPYIKGKMKEDARIYADTKFLERMSKKLLLQQLRQIDNGDNTARMYEVSNQTMKEIREINKDSSTRRTEIEKLYKEIRRDLGQPEMEDANNNDYNNDENNDESGNIIDTSDLNNKIDMYLKDKKNDDDKNRD